MGQFALLLVSGFTLWAPQKTAFTQPISIQFYDGTSIENGPYLTIKPDGNVVIRDPSKLDETSIKFWAQVSKYAGKCPQ